jgi:hypothetical protein
MAKRIIDNDLGRIQKRRVKIINDVFWEHGYYDQILTQDTFTQLVKDIVRITKLPHGAEEALATTLLEFSDRELTQRLGDLIALKVSGGFHTLKSFKPIAPFSGLADKQWAPVEIAELRYGFVKRNKTYARMRAIVMAGSAVGYELRKVLSMKFVTTIMARELAWGRRDPRPAHSELVQMWFLAELTPTDKGTDIGDFKCAPQHKKHNKGLRRIRSNPCIRHLNHKCHACPLGYHDCWRGTHRYTWIFRTCKRCKKEKAAFDPERPNADVCLACQSQSTRAFWARERRGM